MKRRLLILLLTIIIVSLLAACSSTSGKEANEHVKIGVTGADGPYWDIITEKAKEKGIDIELVEFSDYIQPNNSLANGEIDMNSFQHLAFLSQFNVENNLDIVPIGSTSGGPTGVYSDKYEDLSEIPNGSQIGISDDPANLGRGLKLLESAGLIKLKDGVGIYPTPDDITENRKNLEFVIMKSQQTARVLPDVAASLINSGIAGQSGLDLDEAILLDDPYSDGAKPYIGVFAVRAEDVDNETYKTIAELYQELEVMEAVKKDTNGSSVVVDISAEKLRKTLEQLEDAIKEGND